MNEKICENCKHFMLHYMKSEKRYLKTGAGHCMYPRIKLRHINAKACEYFTDKEKEKTM